MALYVRVKLCRDLGKAKAHVKYIAFRSRETAGEQRGAFTARSDHAEVGEFADQLGDRLTRHPMANKAYKMHFSLSEREFRQLGLTSWKPIVREAMENLQHKWGKEFDWIAAEHMAKGHPHVHLVIKAVYRDESGRHRQLRLDKQHLEELKREIDRVIERHRLREQDRSRPLQIADTLLRAFDRALREIIGSEREEEHEFEQAHPRRLRRRPPRDSDDRGR
jgi:hypothetical protein